VKEENGLLKIGVSEFAIDQLGDIVFVELVEKGTHLQKGETFGTIESVKAVEEVYLPFSGEVISVNEGVIDNPEILQNDPIGDGWLLIIKSESNVLLDELMNSDEYKSKVVPN
jgi:glycine cleavage system H protein